MATIDKASITATKTDDQAVFKIGFDFTDDTVSDPNSAWLYNWLHAEFIYNSHYSGAEFNAAATAAMVRARKSSTETTIETTLKAAYGITVVRTNPTVTPVNDGHSELLPLFVKVVT